MQAERAPETDANADAVKGSNVFGYKVVVIATLMSSPECNLGVWC